MITTTQCVRGCGDKRDAAGTYLCCGQDIGGKPVEHWWLQPYFLGIILQ